MSPTVWTERSAVGASFIEGIPTSLPAEALFGVALMVTTGFSMPTPTPYVERAAPAFPTMERAAPAAAMTERTA